MVLVWEVCTVICFRLLHIELGKVELQITGSIMVRMSGSLVCEFHHLIIIIMQSCLKTFDISNVFHAYCVKFVKNWVHFHVLLLSIDVALALSLLFCSYLYEIYRDVNCKLTHLSFDDCEHFCVSSYYYYHYLMNHQPLLTHWGRDKIAAILQTTFWSAFSWSHYLNQWWLD